MPPPAGCAAPAEMLLGWARNTGHCWPPHAAVSTSQHHGCTDVLTTSTVPAIKTNSLVTISTISRTCKRAGSTSVPAEPPAPAPGESSPASPVWGRRWRECTAGPCPRSCGGRRSRCTSSGACEGHRKGITAPEWVRLGQGPNTTGRGTPDPPVEHVEVEPGEHALARPTGREGAAPAHHHVQLFPHLFAMK